jgi:hypothetical protein
MQHNSENLLKEVMEHFNKTTTTVPKELYEKVFSATNKIENGASVKSMINPGGEMQMSPFERLVKNSIDRDAMKDDVRSKEIQISGNILLEHSVPALNEAEYETFGRFLVKVFRHWAKL